MKRLTTISLLLLGGMASQAQTTAPPIEEAQLLSDSAHAPNHIFAKVDVEASVDLAAWRNHLVRFLSPVIEKLAKDPKVKSGTYVVYVRFLVEKDGSLSDIKALKDPGYGLGKYAEEAIRTGPRWKAGMYNGRLVRSYHTQPITLLISDK